MNIFTVVMGFTILLTGVLTFVVVTIFIADMIRKGWKGLMNLINKPIDL